MGGGVGEWVSGNGGEAIEGLHAVARVEEGQGRREGGAGMWWVALTEGLGPPPQSRKV